MPPGWDSSPMEGGVFTDDLTANQSHVWPPTNTTDNIPASWDKLSPHFALRDGSSPVSHVAPLEGGFRLASHTTTTQPPGHYPATPSLLNPSTMPVSIIENVTILLLSSLHPSSTTPSPFQDYMPSSTSLVDPLNPLHAGKRVFKVSVTMIVLLVVAYVIVFVLGVVNNSLVVSVIYRNHQLRTVTNYFIANLAIADIMVSVLVLPFTLLEKIFLEWWFGLFWCKSMAYLQGVAVGASVNTLAAVAIERYLAIFFPQTSKLTPRAALVMMAVVWVVPMCIFAPWLFVYTIREFKDEAGFKYKICLPQWRSDENQKMYTLAAVFLTCYLIPLIFIAICYLLIGLRVWKRRVKGIRGSRAERNIHRSKIKIVRMLLVVFIIFVVSWLPLYAIRLRLLFGPKFGKIERTLLTSYLNPVAQWLGASNSCVNPFVYCYFSTSFRRSITAAIRSRSCCSKITT